MTSMAREPKLARAWSVFHSTTRLSEALRVAQEKYLMLLIELLLMKLLLLLYHPLLHEEVLLLLLLKLLSCQILLLHLLSWSRL